MCVSTHVWGGGQQTSCLCERATFENRENTFCRPALCSKTTRFKWPCGLLQPWAPHQHTPTLGQRDWKVQQNPLETETDQRGHNINMPYVLVYGYRWLKELYWCPYTAPLIDCTVSQRINDSFRFHTSCSAAQPVSPNSYQPQTQSSPSNTDKLMDIIWACFQLWVINIRFFIVGFQTHPRHRKWLNHACTVDLFLMKSRRTRKKNVLEKITWSPLVKFSIIEKKLSRMCNFPRTQKHLCE